MSAIEFHPSTIAFVNYSTNEGAILFSEVEAWDIAHHFNISDMKIVWAELKRHKIINTYKGRYAYDVQKLYHFFGNPENTSN